MANEPNNLSRVDRALGQALEQARVELNGQPSICAAVAQRIAQTNASRSLMPRRALQLAAAAILVAFGYCLSRYRGAVSVPPTQLAQSAADMRLNIGGVELTEHIAAILNKRDVVVIWSCQTAMVTPSTVMQITGLPEQRDQSGKYSLIYQRQDPLAGGRTLVCSIFSADPGVSLTCEPPLIEAHAANETIVALGSAPRIASSSELAAAIRSAGGPDSIVHDIRLQTQP